MSGHDHSIGRIFADGPVVSHRCRACRQSFACKLCRDKHEALCRSQQQELTDTNPKER